MTRRFVVFCAVLSMLCTIPTFARNAYTEASNPSDMNEIIELGLEHQGQTIEIKVLLGQMAQFSGGDVSLGLTPIRLDSDRLALKVFEVGKVETADGQVHGTLKWLETVDFVDKVASLHSGTSVQLKGSQKLSLDTVTFEEEDKPTRCRITCGSTTSYGYSIEDSCGRC